MQHVSLGNENNIGLAQSIVPVTGAGQVGIQQTAVVPGPVGVSAFIPPLDLYIVCTSRLVHRQNIQPDGPALQIFDVVLPVDLLDGQIVPFQDDLQQQVGASLVLKNLAHEVVIQQPEPPDDF